MFLIHPYNAKWPQEFEILRQALLEALGPLALRIAHIGSTSVPGLGAKDVIDIQVTVRALSPQITQKLVGAGFIHREDLTQDHAPLGEDDRPELWTKRVFVEPEGQRRANIHIRMAGNPNQRYALLFRDYLRTHPNSARSIELIKREIAIRHSDDKDAYYAIKDPVYDLIWEAAKEWAEVTGWGGRA
jgi:GrpB-like predicted nucleotidyltransferase (UPF0157 family)